MFLYKFWFPTISLNICVHFKDILLIKYYSFLFVCRLYFSININFLVIFYTPPMDDSSLFNFLNRKEILLHTIFANCWIQFCGPVSFCRFVNNRSDSSDPAKIGKILTFFQQKILCSKYWFFCFLWAYCLFYSNNSIFFFLNIHIVKIFVNFSRNFLRFWHPYPFYDLRGRN